MTSLRSAIILIVLGVALFALSSDAKRPSRFLSRQSTIKPPSAGCTRGSGRICRKHPLKDNSEEQNSPDWIFPDDSQGK